MSDILINVPLLIFGLAGKFFAESEMNNVVGYRTERSMQSPEAWKEAHLYFGRVITVITVLLLLAGYWVLRLEFPCALLVAFAGVITAIVLTEIHLAKKFPKDKSEFH